MLYEVELKFPLSDERRVLALLAELGATAGEPVEQSDHYFNHPSRDFRQTDEAFRIRSVGMANCVTYKGPKLDASTKMRREIEVPFADGAAAEQMAAIFLALGFRSVRKVRKNRTPWKLTWNGRLYDLALDRVPSVGTFLEIELIADETGRDEARQAILDLAQRLSLVHPERRSYLELVLSLDQETTPNGA
ncbi:MAG: class IV adenylate cyclase [Planctomycetes bacterium]|nr:class IV adenylate cyclase [Planctomycetota bacterium]